MPEVSVIIPTYNSAQFIVEALQSVFDQTFKDYEIIIVNDGSTDHTQRLISKYINRVKYIYQENAGPAKAKNRGIMNSSGIYVAFLDADDVWLPTKLEKQVSVFHRNPVLGMVFTENSCFDEKRGIYMRSIGKRDRLMKGDIARNIFLHSGVSTPTVMVRKEIFNEIGLFEEELYMGEDDNMWVRIAANFGVELIDEPLVKVRSHAHRTTVNKSKLFESIEANINLLNCRYKGVKERIEDVIPLKLSWLQFEVGYNHFENLNFVEARKSFARGIQLDMWNWRNYGYWLLTLLPERIVMRIKWFKRRLLSFSIND
jgi:glycosyltransferase involved in cell wall biosynthesis